MTLLPVNKDDLKSSGQGSSFCCWISHVIAFGTTIFLLGRHLYKTLHFLSLKNDPQGSSTYFTVGPGRAHRPATDPGLWTLVIIVSAMVNVEQTQAEISLEWQSPDRQMSLDKEKVRVETNLFQVQGSWTRKGASTEQSRVLSLPHADGKRCPEGKG